MRGSTPILTSICPSKPAANSKPPSPHHTQSLAARSATSHPCSPQASEPSVLPASLQAARAAHKPSNPPPIASRPPLTTHKASLPARLRATRAVCTPPSPPCCPQAFKQPALSAQKVPSLQRGFHPRTLKAAPLACPQEKTAREASRKADTKQAMGKWERGKWEKRKGGKREKKARSQTKGHKKRRKPLV